MSGLFSQFGYKLESTWGTGVVVDTFPAMTSWSLSPTATRVQGAGIQTGVTGPLASQYAQATSGAVGSLALEVQTANILGLLKLIMGTTATSAQQAATAAYLHTFTLSSPLAVSATMQGGRPQRDGTVVPATVTGAKVTGAGFSISGSENLTMSLEVDGKAWESDTTALAASAGSIGSVFGFQTLTVKAGTYDSEAAVTGIRGMSLDIARPLDTEAYYAGAAGVKGEQLLNDLNTISGSLTVDYIDNETFEDLANSMSGTSLVFEFVGANIEDTYDQTFRITVPGAYFEPNQAQGVDGPSYLATDWSWSWKFDGTNTPKIEVINTETAI